MIIFYRNLVILKNKQIDNICPNSSTNHQLSSNSPRNVHTTKIIYPKKLKSFDLQGCHGYIGISGNFPRLPGNPDNAWNHAAPPLSAAHMQCWWRWRTPYI